MTPIKNISLYIPHVFTNYVESDIIKVFETMEIGKIDHIDFVSKMGTDGKPYNAAYIHFNRWFDTITAFNFQDRILDPSKDARVVYEDPWYWIVLENKSNKRATGDRKQCLDVGGLKETTKSKVFKQPEMRKINVEDIFAASSKREMMEMMERMEMMESEISNSLTDEEKQAEFMSEMELLEEESEHIIAIDSRYVKSLEYENIELRAVIEQLKWHFSNAYKAV